MKWCRLLLIFNLFFNTTIGFILPQIFREWHPVAIYDTIDKNKPYHINYGKRSLVLLFNNTTPQTTIVNNNLSEAFGKTIVQDGIIWWTYKSLKKTPPSYFRNNLRKIDNNSLRNIVLDF